MGNSKISAFHMRQIFQFLGNFEVSKKKQRLFRRGFSGETNKALRPKKDSVFNKAQNKEVNFT
ncbi:hypothetical protein AALP_AA2G218700 [Arabis alpina]|uniref:Uncharacterized protein n=1 Tax=Arabis alpina TaxID=50452 RepID=A0A087HJ55_ARAAL|nr:hypothetical protein AALP_AA2G218700 [Arabis alpina]